MILPYLYPDAEADFGGRVLYEPLFSADLAALRPDEPLVGYREVEGSPFDLLEPAGQRPAAVAALEAHYRHAPHDLDLGRGIKMAVLCGFDCSASTVLNPAEMHRLQAHLGGSGLWVSMPNQATLYAMRADGGPAHYESLLTMTDRCFHDRENFPHARVVSYTIWQMVDGRITGRATPPTRDPRPWWKKLF